MEKSINIAGLDVTVKMDQSFRKITGLINQFSQAKERTGVYISIVKNTEREVILSPDHYDLVIRGEDIDNLTDPFNYMGILQAMFRFASIHLAKIDTFLLHGSSSLFRNKAICFGD